MTIATLLVNVAANTATLEQSVSKVHGQMDSLAGTASRVGLALAGAFSFGAIANAANQALVAASNIQDAAEKIGISAEAVQRLGFAAKQGGASIDTVAVAIRTMAGHLQDPGKGAVDAMAALGLNITKLRAMSPDKAFTTIADAIAKIPDPLRQSALAQDLLGRSAQQLLPAIKAGFTEIGKAAPVMSNAVVKSGDDVGDKFQKMSMQMENLKAQALIPLLSTFTSMPASLQVAGAGLMQLAPALSNVGIAIMAAGGPMVALGALKTALMSMSVLLTLPAGLIAAAVIGLVAIFMNWDKIAPIVQRVYEAVKTWLVDRFTAVIDSVKKKVDAVTGFFGDMYKKVVGNSYVPDMVNAIGMEFGRLDSMMIDTSEHAAMGVMGIFQNLAGALPNMLAQAFGAGGGGIMGMLQNLLGGGAGGGLLGSGITKGLTSLFNNFSGGISSLFGTGLSAALGAAIPGIGAVVGPLLSKGLGAVWGGLKNVFGGPNEAEKSGRIVAQEFRTELESMLTHTQRLEAGNDSWKQSVIAIRDSYIAAGKSEAEALAMSQRLWEAEKKGPEAVRAVIQDITSIMSNSYTPSVEHSVGVMVDGFGQAEDGVLHTMRAVEGLKAQIASPVHFSVTYDVNHPTSTKADEVARVASSSDAQLADMIRGFLSGNPGDRHRIPSALGIPMEKVAALGFAGGTGGRFLNFGSGTDVRLHGRERVVTEAEGRADSRRLQTIENELARQRRDLPRAITIGLRDALVLAGVV